VCFSDHLHRALLGSTLCGHLTWRGLVSGNLQSISKEILLTIQSSNQLSTCSLQSFNFTNLDVMLVSANIKFNIQPMYLKLQQLAFCIVQLVSPPPSCLTRADHLCTTTSHWPCRSDSTRSGILMLYLRSFCIADTPLVALFSSSALARNAALLARSTSLLLNHYRLLNSCHTAPFVRYYYFYYSPKTKRSDAPTCSFSATPLHFLFY